MDLLCDCCDLWTHANVSSIEYKEFVLSQSFHWMCPRCLLSQLPFHDCSILSSCFDGASVSPEVQDGSVSDSGNSEVWTTWVRVIPG